VPPSAAASGSPPEPDDEPDRTPEEEPEAELEEDPEDDPLDDPEDEPWTDPDELEPAAPVFPDDVPHAPSTPSSRKARPPAAPADEKRRMMWFTPEPVNAYSRRVQRESSYRSRGRRALGITTITIFGQRNTLERNEQYKHANGRVLRYAC
jgi:hypothetical protein